MALNGLEDQVTFYHHLHQRWRSINETSSLADIFTLTLSFISEELGFSRALIFVHDDATGLFRVQAHCGYEDPKQIRLLHIVTLLLSGEIVEHLRFLEDSITHTPKQPSSLVASLLASLKLSEAFMMLFSGNENVPFGLIVVGNATSQEDTLLYSPCSMIALRNVISNLSYATNNALFYQSWHHERLHLKENIDKRTKELNEQKERFEGIYQTSKDGIAILDVYTTAFLDFNPAYLEMTEFSRPELLRTSCLALTYHDDRSETALVIQEVLDKGFVKDFVKRCVTKHGKVVSVNVSLVLMSDQQKVLISAKDITHRIQLEQDLRTAKEKIEAAHNHTLSSIEYASLIQRSLLPEEGLWQAVVRDHFCIWQPKDVVGGDIFTLTQMRHEDEVLIMLIDCTGHGVPGAFVTMLVKAVEQQIFNKLKTVEGQLSPAKLLSSFHRQLVKMLKYDERTLIKHIGFDGAVVFYNRKEQRLCYAGAQIPLFYMLPDQEEPSVQVIKGNRQSIGYQKFSEDVEFTDHILSVQQGMRFYLTTDGFSDQLGGTQGMPLGKKRFQQTLIQHAKSSLAEQSDALTALLSQHQHGQVQTDDITVLGFEV